MTTKHKQFMARMKYNTYLRLRAVFPCKRGESAASYFERLAKFLEDLKILVEREEGVPDFEAVVYNDIKQEAIKLLKSVYSYDKITGTWTKKGEVDWRKFLNISEEDLK